ncbi:MAG: hypothetical protein JKX93_13775 [Rhizobiaceae bacterium]|nr:hypothetical protein [Rhizobiaceae bacterium]MBL4696587.1 hypothetical protein [Rhizobiaceae bacterium]
MTQSYQDHLTSALLHLQNAKRVLSEEITHYPTPISGCDAQFNHLLSERQKVSEAICALEAQPFIPTPRNLENNIQLAN